MWGLLLIALFICKLARLYISAKPAHRREMVDLCWYANKTYGKTGISIPRAFVPLFRCFEHGKFGAICQAARVIVITKIGFLIGEMEEKRCINGIKMDLGTGGMIKSNQSNTHPL